MLKNVYFCVDNSSELKIKLKEVLIMLHSIKKVSEFLGKDYRTVIKMCEKRGVLIVDDGGKSISDIQLDILLKKLGYNGVEDYNE